MAHQIGKELLLTKWTFKEIMRKLANTHKWATAPIPRQWSQVLRTGGSKAMNIVASRIISVFEDYMFDPAQFSVEQTTLLRSICSVGLNLASAHRLRKGTEDEWSIIIGTAEGHIACRRMPDLINAVFNSDERLRLVRTVQAQV